MFNFAIYSVLAVPIVVDVARTGVQSRQTHYSAWYYYPDVVNYYNENVTDNLTTLGFYCNELITFSNRTIIDLYLPIYSSSLYSVIKNANVSQVLNLFQDLKVGYFLEPKPANPFYGTYQKLLNSTILNKVFLDNSHFQVLTDFQYAILYRFYSNFTIYA